MKNQRFTLHGRYRIAVLTAAVAAAIAFTAAVEPAAGTAAYHHFHSHGTPYRHGDGRAGHARLVHGVLFVSGTRGADNLALRLQAGVPGTLEVDFGDDGSADAAVARADVAAIVVNTRAGDDRVRIDEGNGPIADISTTIDGGGGDDTIAGGSGAETLIGGYGNDTIDGNGGDDTAVLGAGDDTFVWDPGDGSDRIEGAYGLDTMVFNGAGAAEQVDLSANGGRLRFFRTQGNITMDTAGVERVEFNALGGADAVTVNDLSGTDVDAVVLDLAGSLGGAAGDGQADRVTVNGAEGNDRIEVTGDAGGVKVSGLAATVELRHAESADGLDVETHAGRDAVDTAGLAAGTLRLFVNGVAAP